MAESTAAAREADAQPLCPSAELIERGDAFVFDVLHVNGLARAFVLRFEGQVRGYLNRCVHVAAEMDWLPGKFLDADARFILCSIHGAAYEPSTGRCVGGPCGRASLTPIDVEERDGQVYWYPSRDIRPAFAD